MNLDVKCRHHACRCARARELSAMGLIREAIEIHGDRVTCRVPMPRLAAVALHGARLNYQRFGHVIPVALIETNDDFIQVVMKLDSDDSRAASDLEIREILEKRNASAIAIVAEACEVETLDDHVIEDYEASLEEHPRRRSVLLVSYESRGEPGMHIHAPFENGVLGEFEILQRRYLKSFNNYFTGETKA